MAKKQRSLKTQLNYAVSESKKTGQSKHADKHNPNIDTKNFIYSDESADAYRDTITNLVNYMKEAHPEIKYVRDLILSIKLDAISSNKFQADRLYPKICVKL